MSMPDRHMSESERADVKKNNARLVASQPEMDIPDEMDLLSLRSDGLDALYQLSSLCRELEAIYCCDFSTSAPTRKTSVRRTQSSGKKPVCTPAPHAQPTYSGG